MNNSFANLSLFEKLTFIRAILPSKINIYLVGGAVRDCLLGRTIHDLDFTLPQDAIKTGRKVADALGAAFYPLDIERDAGRVIYTEQGNRISIDFASFRRPDLESDLRERDFTINAMALDIHQPEKLIDPCQGGTDLRKCLIRACSSSAFSSDPLRILRCVRQSVELSFMIDPITISLARSAKSGLLDVSEERLRDEIFRIFDTSNPAAAIQLLDAFGVISYIFPELEGLKQTRIHFPIADNLWDHAIHIIQNLTSVLGVLSPVYDMETATNWTMGLISLKLGRYRHQLYEHFNDRINIDRSIPSLLFFTVLYLYSGKLDFGSGIKDQNQHNNRNLSDNSKLLRRRCENLRLNTAEINWAERLVRLHRSPILSSKIKPCLSRRSIYHFFREAQSSGVDICLLSLADSLAIYGATIPQDHWETMLDTIRILFEAWWEKPDEAVNPPALVDGHDLIEHLHVTPGPLVGKLLEVIRENQAAGEIIDAHQALEFACDYLSKL